MKVTDCRLIMRQVLRDLNPTTIRTLVSAASLLWAISLILGPQTFQQRGWGFSSSVSTESAWAAVFALHFLGTFWRMIDPKSRPRWALLINVYGFAIWIFITVAGNLAVGLFTPANAMEWIMVSAQGWVVVMTGRKKEVVTL